MQPVLMTTQQQTELQGRYLIIDQDRVIPLAEPIGLTEETFKAYWVNNEDILMELTADDFYWYNPDEDDKDFAFTDELDCIIRNDIPSELVEFLDAVIEERMAAETEQI